MTAVGVANALPPKDSMLNDLLNTSMLPAPASLAANNLVSVELMASPVKLAPATDVWVSAWRCGELFQAAIEPLRLAKMKSAGLPFPPLVVEMSKPALLEPANAAALATCPVGPEAPAGGMLTVNRGPETFVLPVTAKSGAVCVPWSEIQMGLPFANETPQGFTRLGSVAVARPGMSETRFD